MFKNVSGQKLIVFAFDSTTNLPKTADAANITAYVSKDYGAVTVLGDTTATEVDATNAKGYYLFDLTAGETNADTLLFSAKSATANVVVVGVPAAVFTTPPNFTALSVDGSGRVDVAKVAGTAQTARDLGASVLLSAGTGAGQLDFTAGVVKANWAQVLGTTLTEGAGGRLKAAITTFFDVAAPVLTTASVNQTGDNFARVGATGSGLTSLAPASTALSTATWTNGRAARLDNLPAAAAGSANGMVILGTNTAGLVIAPAVGAGLSISSTDSDAVSLSSGGDATAALHLAGSNNAVGLFAETAANAAVSVDAGGAGLAVRAGGAAAGVSVTGGPGGGHGVVLQRGSAAADDLLLAASDAPTLRDAVLTAGAITNTTVTAALANKLADHGRRRTQANVEASADGDALDRKSLYGFIQEAQNASLSGTTLTVKKTDGTTLGSFTVTTDAAALPVTGVS